ncbi:MoaD/ThiS family protein [Leucothrix pacifica]|uniref:Molybdopterin synthase sulfur carrier subunit n=1 Tax=Leucothrix pacifica TaxID=1247513 RepID=A0A317C1L5_9GAMM|nr:MoaD/ThiS family protein [Leucothrix pacifica]PWQ92438.1 molybdopterin synthase sulfur carrier subunit [Leucothrix pacifica]
MKVTFKLFATLMEHLPPEADRHELPLEVDESTSAYDLIDRFNVPRELAHLVLVNGVYLQPNERELPLKENDVLAVFPPVAGG